MPEKTLDELIELSKPALRHAEIIEIVRVENPSKADEKASTRWPRRQAKAARFLAMLRRDYGHEAFEASLLEHARPQGSEHAQGVPILTFDSVFPVGVRHLHFVLDIWDGRGVLENIQIAEYRKGWPHRKNVVTVQDEIKRLCLNKEQQQELVRRIIDSMYVMVSDLELEPYLSGEMWSAALAAIRELLPDDKELLRKTLLTTVVYLGGRAEHAMTFALDLGASPPEGTRNNSQKALQCGIDYMLEQGCSEATVSKAWAEMLDKRSKQGYHAVLVYEWWAGLKIGKTQVDDYSNGIAQPAARHCVRKELSWFLENNGSDFGQHYGHAVEESQMRVLKSMVGNCGSDWQWREGREMFEEMLTACLARGQAGKAFYFFTRFGEEFRLHEEGEHNIRTYNLKLKFVPLVRGAIDS